MAGPSHDRLGPWTRCGPEVRAEGAEQAEHDKRVHGMEGPHPLTAESQQWRAASGTSLIGAVSVFLYLTE